MSTGGERSGRQLFDAAWFLPQPGHQLLAADGGGQTNGSVWRGILKRRVM